MFNDEEIVTPIENEVEPATIIGTVSGCFNLNVREKPDLRAPVACVIPENAEVIIDEKESTDRFYKVFTSAGIEGYCMKTYISTGVEY